MEESKIQEMQILEQNLQNLLLQKQAFQMELSETEAALKEIEKADEEVFKIIGQLMIKTNKSDVKKDLLNKQKILDMRLKPLEKQESALSTKIEEIREELMKSMNKKEK
jgi:prefoldin beta subunit